MLYTNSRIAMGREFVAGMKRSVKDTVHLGQEPQRRPVLNNVVVVLCERLSAPADVAAPGTRAYAKHNMC